MKPLFADSQNIWHVILGLAYLALTAVLFNISRQKGMDVYNTGLFNLFILTLATFRLIRLFSYDYITEFLRKYLDQYPRGLRRELADMLDCPWCSGMWMALVAGYLYVVLPVSQFLLFILALSGAATFIQITIWKIGKE